MSWRNAQPQLPRSCVALVVVSVVVVVGIYRST